MQEKNPSTLKIPVTDKPEYTSLFSLVDAESTIALSGLTLETREYAFAYYQGGLKLLDDLLQRHAFDFEALPMLYLFRHYVELMLKGCILNARVLAFGIYKEHDDPSLASHDPSRLLDVLLSLWRKKKVNATLRKVVGEPIFFSPSAIKFIRELGRLDPGSYRLRYPSDKKGKPSLPREFTFSTVAFAAGMDFLKHELARVYGQIEITVFATDEFLQAFQKEMASVWPR